MDLEWLKENKILKRFTSMFFENKMHSNKNKTYCSCSIEYYPFGFSASQQHLQHFIGLNLACSPGRAVYDAAIEESIN